jgi:hypothetical protein
VKFQIPSNSGDGEVEGEKVFFEIGSRKSSQGFEKSIDIKGEDKDES